MGFLVSVQTRLSPYITAADKRYEARFRLGVVSDTYDRQGEISTVAPEEVVTKDFPGRYCRIRACFVAVLIRFHPYIQR